jgi:hypothetical protein
MPTPYETFEKSMRRVRGLLDLHPRLHGVRGRPAQHVSDVLRGALVLDVGALDALVLESVIAAIPAAADEGRLGPTVGKWVKDKPDAFLATLSQPAPKDALADLCRGELGQMTFQRSATIEGVLHDLIGCNPPWPVAAIELTATGEVAWEPDEVKDRLDEFVQRRHRIAHSADLRSDALAALPIRRGYVEEAERDQRGRLRRGRGHT